MSHVPKVSTVALTPNSSSSPPPTPTTPSVPLAEKCPLPSPTSPPSTESLPGASQGSRQLTSAKNTSKSRSKKKALAKRNLLPASSAALLPHTSLPAAVVIAKTKAAVSSVSSAASHRSTALPTKGRCSADGTENASPSPLQQSTAQPGHLHTSQPLTQPKELMPEPSHSAYPTPPVAELAVNSQPLSEDLFAHCQPIHRPKAVGRRSSSSLMPSDTTTSRSPPSQKMVTRSLEPSPELRARLSTTATSPRIHPFDSLSDATAIPPQPYLSSDGSRSCRRPAPTAKWFSPFDPHWQVSLDFLRSERQRQSQCRPPPGFPATPAGTTRPPLPLTQHRPASTAWDGFNALSTRHQRSASEQTSMPQPPPGLSNSRTGLCLPSPNNLPLRSSLDQSSLPMASQSVLLQAEPTASMLTTGRGPGGFGLSTSLAMAAPPPHYNLSFDGCLTTANDYRRPFTANAGGVAKYGAGNARRSSISPMLPSSCWNPASPMVMDPQPVPLPFQANGTNSARAAHLHQQPIGETSSLHFSAPLPDN
ncbi:hypothetical protein H4R34_001231 [Dimargaris verticillata]|uniref:Uncharacterized protein n=1 Tax=Dimargaris verticillata TaxID=2761393 RepID=A0A9W8EAI0_9FUNG|nr:hypothetical protein H4R34_001231 [Dimargaris verticillata]